MAEKIAKGDKMATRQAYGKVLVELGAENPNLVVMDADLSKSTMTADFGKAYPDRFFNMGIAEQNLYGTACGLALSGKTVCASTFAMFAAGRAFEIIRNSIGYTHANVKVCATHAGITVGEDGASHQTFEDIALMRTIPGMTVVNPSDGVSAMKLLRQVAQKRGLIVFTDSDGAGFVIRNHLKSAIDGRYLKHAYIPDIPGKEKRKASPGKEGKLGVEGMRPEIILDALRRAGATIEGEEQTARRSEISRQDMVDLGLSGGNGSSLLRKKLLKKLDLPEHLSSNGLLQAINLLYTREEFLSLTDTLEKEYG